jgi:hypothetical protein
MATGIQHVQATQLFELSSSSTKGISALRKKKFGRTLTLYVVHVLGAGHYEVNPIIVQSGDHAAIPKKDVSF